MAKILKSKYNSTGERCVDACLSYGEIRYVNEDGSPTIIEIPHDCYGKAMSDFKYRIREGIAQKKIEPNKILKEGCITYNEAKNIASSGKINELEFFTIDGSIECDNVLGISGSIEYALSIWNGESKEDALKKSIIRAITVYGEDFIYAISSDDLANKTSFLKFARYMQETKGKVKGIELYEAKYYPIDDELHENNLNQKKIIKKYSKMGVIGFIATIGVIAEILGIMSVKSQISFKEIINNKIIDLFISIVVIIVLILGIVRVAKHLTIKYLKNSTLSVIEMFNEELYKSINENLLTGKEAKEILTNITKGDVLKLLIDMKGSVNKKLSINAIVTKESKFIIDEREVVILPSEYEIKQMLKNLVSSYKDNL